MATVRADTEEFRFLDLPGEIRNLIYTYALPFWRVEKADPDTKKARFLNTDNASNAMSLLLVNKQVHAEAKPLLYASSTFVADFRQSTVRHFEFLEHSYQIDAFFKGPELPMIEHIQNLEMVIDTRVIDIADAVLSLSNVQDTVREFILTLSRSDSWQGLKNLNVTIGVTNGQHDNGLWPKEFKQFMEAQNTLTDWQSAARQATLLVEPFKYLWNIRQANFEILGLPSDLLPDDSACVLPQRTAEMVTWMKQELGESRACFLDEHCARTLEFIATVYPLYVPEGKGLLLAWRQVFVKLAESGQGEGYYMFLSHALLDFCRHVKPKYVLAPQDKSIDTLRSHLNSFRREVTQWKREYRTKAAEWRKSPKATLIQIVPPRVGRQPSAPGSRRAQKPARTEEEREADHEQIHQPVLGDDMPRLAMFRPEAARKKKFTIDDVLW